jgi:hypothetical protein
MKKNDLVIWRYLKLSLFLKMLERNVFSFSNVTTMSDATEGSLKEISLYDSIVFAGKNKKNSEIERIVLNSKIDDALKEYYISSWTISTSEKCKFWNIFTLPNDGVALKTTVGRLNNCISSNINMEERRIQYFPDRKSTFSKNQFDISNRIFTKYALYTFENEYRFAFRSSKNKENGEIIKYNEIPINYSSLLSAIYLSPMINPDNRKQVRDSIISLSPTLSKKIHPSIL